MQRRMWRMSCARQDSSDAQGCLPSFLDINAAKGLSCWRTRRFEGMVEFVEAFEFIDDWICKGDAAGATVFGLFEIGEAIVEV